MFLGSLGYGCQVSRNLDFLPTINSLETSLILWVAVRIRNADIGKVSANGN